MSVTLPPEIERFVEDELAAGSYSSRDELIAVAVDLLRRHQNDLERLKADIAEGLEGEGVPADEVFAQMRAKYTSSSSDATP